MKTFTTPEMKVVQLTNENVLCSSPSCNANRICSPFYCDDCVTCDGKYNCMVFECNEKYKG